MGISWFKTRLCNKDGFYFAVNVVDNNPISDYNSIVYIAAQK